MTEYLKPKFSVALGSQNYRDNYDAIFGKKKAQFVKRIVSDGPVANLERIGDAVKGNLVWWVCTCDNPVRYREATSEDLQEISDLLKENEKENGDSTG